MAALLFPKADLPRAPRRRRLRVIDAGNFPDGRPAIRYGCSHCGYQSVWLAADDERDGDSMRGGYFCPGCKKVQS